MRSSAAEVNPVSITVLLSESGTEYMGNLDLAIAAHDYVLVGRVERQIGTRHLDGYAYPLTDFEVTILNVIKGKLYAGQKIPITKHGGISKDKSTMALESINDFIPETGGVYIFLVGVWQDGKTLQCSPTHHTIVPLESSIVTELNQIEESTGSNKDKQELISKSLQKSKIFARYAAAAKNKNAEKELPLEIQEIERHKSVYEK